MQKTNPISISIITPTVRPELLPIVAKCLEWQTETDWEWIVVAPQNLFLKIDRQIGHEFYYEFVPEPPKKEGDFYGLNKAWNAGLKKAQGELFVSIVDGLWFPPETLERLWNHYEADPLSCIGLVGDQYSKIENGKPENKVWIDPRKRINTFYEISPVDLELCIASLPIEGVKDVGGFDETFDKFPAWGEKELACRMNKAGYKCFLDQSIEYRAIYHPRLNEEWDKKYPESVAYFQKCYKDIQEGKRLKLEYLSKS